MQTAQRVCGLLFVGLATILLANPPAWSQMEGESDPFAELTDEEVELTLNLLDFAEAAEATERWEDAIEAYAEIATMVTVPSVQIRAAACHEELGQFREAAAIYSSIADSNDADAAFTSASALERLWRDYPARVAISVVPTDARVSVNGAVQAPSPDGRYLIILGPGMATVSIEKEGFEANVARFDPYVGFEMSRNISLEPSQEVELAQPDRDGGSSVRFGVGRGFDARSARANEVDARTAPRRNWALPGGFAIATLLSGAFTGMVYAADDTSDSVESAMLGGTGGLAAITLMATIGVAASDPEPSQPTVRLNFGPRAANLSIDW